MHILGNHEENTLEQMREVDRNSVKSALMADGHLGYVMPIGGVAACENQISPVRVGFDIACGNCALKTDMKIEDIEGYVGLIADSIQSQISFGVGRNNQSKDSPDKHELFDDDRWKILGTHERDRLRKLARNQLGTVGSGNHYVDVFHDEEKYIWVGVHFGSRGFGHNIATGFLNLAQNRKWDERNPPEIECLLDLSSDLGNNYWELMQLAGVYAYAGRDWVAQKVVKILGGKILDQVHNHHNFAWKEYHIIDGAIKGVIVTRKGATPAFPGQRGFVGGSMGDKSVVLEGVEPNKFDSSVSLQDQIMYSTVHGAGRVMSRSAAKGKISKSGEVKREPLVTNDMMNEWIKKWGVTLRGGGVDESPQVYRRLKDVLKDQGPTIRILHELTPMIVVMAGENEFDPYKD